MHLSAFPPALVPQQFCSEIEAMSKAELMDMVWDFAMRCSVGGTNESAIGEFRTTRKMVLIHRKIIQRDTIKKREKLESRHV